MENENIELMNCANVISRIFSGSAISPEQIAELTKALHQKLYQKKAAIEEITAPCPNTCSKCNQKVNEKVKEYSIKNHKKVLCFKCQKDEEKK